MIQEDVRTPQESFTDKIGQTVCVGDTIVYGHALGRCAGLRIGKVLKIETVARAYRHRGDDPEWSIQVRGIDDDGIKAKPKLNKRTGTLQFPNRTIKLTVPLPEAYTTLLETVCP